MRASPIVLTAFLVGAGISWTLVSGNPTHRMEPIELSGQKSSLIEGLLDLRVGTTYINANPTEWRIGGGTFTLHGSELANDVNGVIPLPYVFGNDERIAEVRYDEGKVRRVALKPNGQKAPVLTPATIQHGSYSITFQPRPIVGPTFPLIYDLVVSGPGSEEFAVGVFYDSDIAHSQEPAFVHCSVKEPGRLLIPYWEHSKFRVSCSRVSKSLEPMSVRQTPSTYEVVLEDGTVLASHERIRSYPGNGFYGNDSFGATWGRLEIEGRNIGDAWLLRTVHLNRRHEGVAHHFDFSNFLGKSFQASRWGIDDDAIWKNIDLRLPDPGIFDIHWE